MKVKMCIATNHKGLKKKGKEYDVDSITGERWVKRGLATEVVEAVDVGYEEVEEEEVEETEVEMEEMEAPKEHDDLSAKELYTECKNLGIDVKAKQSKAYYIAILAKDTI